MTSCTSLKKILLISDTHGYLEPKLIKHIESSDEVWHAGDIGSMALCREIEKLKPLKAVFGNIDGQDLRMAYTEDLIFTIEEVKVLMTHIGGGSPDKYPARIKKLLKEHTPKVFICGHS